MEAAIGGAPSGAPRAHGTSDVAAISRPRESADSGDEGSQQRRFEAGLELEPATQDIRSTKGSLLTQASL
jgi:hypothetical protein